MSAVTPQALPVLWLKTGLQIQVPFKNSIHICLGEVQEKSFRKRTDPFTKVRKKEGKT